MISSVLFEILCLLVEAWEARRTPGLQPGKSGTNVRSARARLTVRAGHRRSGRHHDRCMLGRRRVVVETQAPGKAERYQRDEQ